jgi:hypothetical protein
MWMQMEIDNLGLDPVQVVVRCLALGGATIGDGGKCCASCCMTFWHSIR